MTEVAPKGPTLFDIVHQNSMVLQQILESGGELSPELEEEFSSVNLILAEKVDSYNFVMERMEHEASYWKAKAEFYSKVARAHTRLRDRLKDSIKVAMRLLEKEEITGNDVRFKLSSTKPALVIDPAELDPTYTMQVTETVPDKKRIEEELKFGIEIKGARLEPSFSLRSYANKKVKT